jgi:hypothetical protein
MAKGPVRATKNSSAIRASTTGSRPLDGSPTIRTLSPQIRSILKTIPTSGLLLNAFSGEEYQVHIIAKGNKFIHLLNGRVGQPVSPIRERKFTSPVG